MKKVFEPLRKELEHFDSEREVLIKRSREILKNSKGAIYALHRGDIKGATALLAEAKGVKEALDKKIKDLPKLAQVGAYSEALEEYAEAQTFLAYMTGKELPTPAALGLDVELYLQGLCDTTGELMRRAVNAVIEGKTKEMQEIKAFVGEVYEQMMLFDFRNSPLRSKFDRVKGTVEKLEDLALKIHLREKA